MQREELLNKYRILYLMHRGPCGEVWVAEHTEFPARRLLKVIDRRHPYFSQLFREAHMLQQCRHPSIPIIYDIFEIATKIYIVEEFIEGETLKDYILRLGKLPGSLLLNYSIQLCDILQYIHNPLRNILHLDIKPENILVSNHQVKLVDFGSAIYQNQPGKYFFGTPGFCAPEQEQAGILSEETDIYGFGKCLQYMLLSSGDIPCGLQKIAENCLRKGRKKYATAEELGSDLKKIKSRGRREKPKEIWYAVSGVLSEYDSTETAVALAGVCKRMRGAKVLYLDCTRTHCLEKIRQKEDGFVWERDGITIAGRVSPWETAGFHDRGFSVVICDFGTESPAVSGQLFEKTFLVGGMNAWTKESWMKQTELLGPCCRNPVFLILSGDTELAQACLGARGNVAGISLYHHGLGHPGGCAKQLKSLLRQKKR